MPAFRSRTCDVPRRTGWAVGNALPYIFGGLAVGRVDVSRAATVHYDKYDDFDTITPTLVGFDPVGNPIFVNVTSHSTVFLGSNTQSSQERRSNSFVPGWTAGLGMEYMLWGNLFMRGEWEYVRFLNVKDITFLHQTMCAWASATSSDRGRPRGILT